MKDGFAKFVSGISSPYVVATGFGLWAVAAKSGNLREFALYSALFFILIVLLPFLYILVNIKLGHISDIHVTAREQRHVPFIVAVIGAVILTLDYLKINAPLEMVALAVCLIVSGIVFGIITYFWKISIHAASYTGAVIMVAFLIDFRLLVLFVFLPLVVWARLVRNRHDPVQALVAALLNAVCTAGTLALILR